MDAIKKILETKRLNNIENASALGTTLYTWIPEREEYFRNAIVSFAQNRTIIPPLAVLGCAPKLRTSSEKPRRMRIVKRLERIELGNLGNHEFIGQGLAELREGHGAGYGIYLCFWHGQTIVLLAAGNKATQSKDIEQAKQRMAEYVDKE